jgi:NAD(P)-dependent dehydrogenase (short-subunit alcohol dehydrogenase family)
MSCLNNRVALITGAGSGIGRAIALKFAEHGAGVVVLDIDEKHIDFTVNEIQAARGKALGVLCDVTDPEQVKKAIQGVISSFGNLHVLVNSAGIGPLTPLEEITLEEWNQVLCVNLTGPFLMIQAALPYLRDAAKDGRLINIGSLAGQIGGISVGLHYTASKGGLIALTRQMARILAPRHATANCISPGTTETPMTEDWPKETLENLEKQIPLGRLAQPEDVANAALFLASDEAQFITGATINVNGGMFVG